MSKTIIELIAQDNSAQAVAKVEKVLGKKLLRAINERASTVARETYGTIKEFFGDDQPQFVNPSDSAYAAFFANALKKFGVNGPEDFTDENTKAQFFQYVDNNWKAQDSVQGIAAPSGPTMEIGTQTQLPPTATVPQPPITPDAPAPMDAPPDTAPMPDAPVDAAPVPPPMAAPVPPTPAPMPSAAGFQIPQGYMLVLHPATGQLPYGGSPAPADSSMAAAGSSIDSQAPMGAQGGDPSLDAAQADQSGQNPAMGDDDGSDPDLEIGPEDEGAPMDDEGGPLGDHDGDGIPNQDDPDFDPNDDFHSVDVNDDDGDGIPNSEDDDHNEDVDDDGIPNSEDDDNSTFDPGFGDEDGDGIPDNQDLDADGNGLYDDTEDADEDGVPDRSDADADGDGVADPDDVDGGSGAVNDTTGEEDDLDGEDEDDDDPFGDDDDYNVGESDFGSDDAGSDVPDVDGDGKPEQEVDVDGDGDPDLVVGDDPDADEEDPDLEIGDDDEDAFDDSDEDDDSDDEDEDEDEEEEPKKVEDAVKPKKDTKNYFPRNEDFGMGVDNEMDKLFIKEELEPQIQDAKEDGNKDLVKKLQAAKQHLKDIKTNRDKHLSGLRKHRAAIMADKTLSSEAKNAAKKEIAALGKEHAKHCRSQARRIKKLHTGK